MSVVNIETLLDNYNFANTYLVTINDEVIIIDPACDIKYLKKYVGNKKVLGVFLTHGHYDHFKTLEDVLKDYNVKCYLHKNAKVKVLSLDTSYANMFGCFKIPNLNENDFVFVNDGQTIKLNDFNIKTLFTPGHTNCSVVYILDDVMFSGDTLFNMSVGRTDLATGNAITQMNTLNMLKKMKTDYKIYPGHENSTTLFFEQKNNPYMNR